LFVTAPIIRVICSKVPDFFVFVNIKGKEEYLYSAFIQRLVSKLSDMDHTVLPANYTMPAFFRKRSPDGAFTKCGGERLIAAHY